MSQTQVLEFDVPLAQGDRFLTLMTTAGGVVEGRGPILWSLR